MGSRNALDFYDPNFARKQTMLAEPHKYSGGRPSGGSPGIQLPADVQKKLMDALAKENAKLRARDEERRRRDPTYRPDAIELSNASLLEFDKYVDYYEILGIDQFASAAEVKNAYKQRSLEVHPDKQTGKSEGEKKQAADDFLKIQHANSILADLATRRAYDTARDNLDSRNEAGLIDVGKMERPPPTCVDVECTLEQLYRGARKQVDFTRNEFKGTRWAKLTYDSFNVKINRGELEGATIWHKMKGDVGPFGRCDLVFVVKQAPHATFERLGDDLWYYDKSPTPAAQIFYTGWAATMASTKSSAKHRDFPNCRRICAIGSTLPALLGYDRSGLGEAVVETHGMPLRPLALEEVSDGRTRGDLVVKFLISALPPTQRRLHVCNALLMAPIALLTPDNTGRLPASATTMLLTNTILPHMLAHHWRRKKLHHLATKSRTAPLPPPPPLLGDDPLPSRPAPLVVEPPPLSLDGVVLLIGGSGSRDEDDGDGACEEVERAARSSSSSSGSSVLHPSYATRWLMGLLSSALPQLTWRVVRMTGAVTEPLLHDEEMAVEHAAVLLLEALPDAPPPSPNTAAAHGFACGGSCAGGSSAPQGAILLRPANEAVGDVVAPGGAAEGVAKATEQASSSPRAEAAASAAAAAVDVSDESAEMTSQVTQRDKAEQAELDAEVAEDRAWELDGPDDGPKAKGLDIEYLENGCRAAAALMHHWSAAAVKRCHCHGGVVVGIGAGCTLLGHAGPRTYRRVGGLASVNALPPSFSDGGSGSGSGGEGVGSRVSYEELLEIRDECIADDIPIDYPKMRRWSAVQARAYFENNGVMPTAYTRLEAALGGTTTAASAGGGSESSGGAEMSLTLPYLLSVTQRASSPGDRDGWRRLRAATLHAKLDDGRQGFAALGLPPGSVLTVLTTHTFALRSVLGSAQPARIPARRVSEEGERRAHRFKRVKVEWERTHTLKRMQAEIASGANRNRAVPAYAAKSDRDPMGILRGQCQNCSGCDGGYSRPCTLLPSSEFFAHCENCGCLAEAHEQKRR